MNQFSKDSIEKVISFMDQISQVENDFRKQVLFAFRDTFGFNKSNFWLCDESSNLINPVSLNSIESMNDYLNNYSEIDILVPKSISSRINQKSVIDVLDILTLKEYERSEFYNDFMKKHGLFNNIGLFLYGKGNVVGMIDFSWSKKEFYLSSEDRGCLEVLSKYLSKKVCEIEGNTSGQQIENMSGRKYLSPREKEVLELIRKGLSNKEIANTLFISVNTVKKHSQSMYQKLGVTNRTSLCYEISNTNDNCLYSIKR
ncbi:response regulator transcription factor [Salipaludibacillus sp. CF4.18]|uniref:response regulator transcription factor n=1 Tax=Salipaludibacillus sp. CF4.18 TaxID=3373081 RepID=UPI003EE541D6